MQAEDAFSTSPTCVLTLCISLAVVELGIGGSVFNFVSGYYFFDGSVYIFGSWWSVLLVLVGDSKLK